MIRRRVRSGGLIPIHPGVYLVGHRAVHSLAYEAAALFACRPRALLSHHTAMRLWRLPGPEVDEIQVTVVGRKRRSLPGVEVHSLSALARSELRRHDGLPITSPSLTLLDMAGVLDANDFADCLNEARVQRLVTDRAFDATLRTHPTRRGAKALRTVLATERNPKLTRSRGEQLALRVMRRHGLEPDGTNVCVGPYRLDFFFRRERVAVEVDGYRFHSTPKRFADDRRRIAYLASRNIQVFPLTWEDLHGRAGQAMSNLRRTLDERRPD